MKTPSLEFVVQRAGRADDGLRAPGGRRLPAGPVEGLPRHADGGTAAVVADRNPFVVRQQRIVRPHQAADRRGVMDGRIEIGVVADLRGQRDIARRFAAPGISAAPLACAILAAGPRTERGARALETSGPSCISELSEESAPARIPCAAWPGICRARQRAQIDDLIADRHAAAKRFGGPCTPEHCRRADSGWGNRTAPIRRIAANCAPGDRASHPVSTAPAHGRVGSKRFLRPSQWHM